MRLLLNILLLFFISCATKSVTKDNLPKEDRTAKLRIIFENSQNNKTILRINLCKELYDSIIKMDEKCEFKTITVLSEKENVSYDLPAGEYFAVFELSDKKVIPVILFESTGIKIKFGYKNETNNYFFYSETRPKLNNITNCRKNGNWECPKLILKENIQTTFKFQINSSYEFDEDGTAFIWIGSIVLSIQAHFPIPLPLFMGSFAIKRDIKHNLK